MPEKFGHITMEGTTPARSFVMGAHFLIRRRPPSYAEAGSVVVKAIAKGDQVCDAKRHGTR